MEKGTISGFQLAVLMYPTIMATISLVVPSLTARHAGNDMWISPIIASVIGFLTIWIVYKLSRLYPGKTPIEYLPEILGYKLGKFVGLIYLLFYLHICGIILREYSDFVIGTFLPRTPMIVIIIMIVLVASYAVNGGIEIIARTAQVFVPIIIAARLIVFTLLIKEFDASNILPFFEDGITPALKGALIPQSWFSEFFIIAFLIPYLTKESKKSVMKYVSYTVVGLLLTMLMINFSTLFLFGDMVQLFTYPWMKAPRYISIADFFEHIETIMMTVWLSGTLIKVAVFYYVFVLGLAQWLELEGYKRIILPTGTLLVLLAIWSSISYTDLTHFLGTSSPFYLTSFQTILPLCFLLIALMLKRREGKNEA